MSARAHLRSESWIAPVRTWLTLANVAMAVACSSTAPESALPDARENSVDASQPKSVTEAADDLRTGHYANQPKLSPAVVSGNTFGQLFSAKVTGQVYAQPLVSKGTLLVVTETNDVYGLDPENGRERWHKNVGAPFDPTTLRCNDLTPDIGITGTPVIDTATNTAYFVAKSTDKDGTHAVMHAMDVATGAEKPNFPVTIAGVASNAKDVPFDPIHHLQRPGLLLMDGTVYAAFGAHCDAAPWQGWIVGVTTSGTQNLWVTNTKASGAGIWQSGGGIMSDGAGRMFVATGNGDAPRGPIPGSRASTTSGIGEAIVRVDVQKNGTLQGGDFFAPYDAQQLDGWDADFASGAPVGLPDSFGTKEYPRLLVGVGKQGYVYLLNRDNLGGIGMGPNGGDASVFRSGVNGGVWSKPAVWPGDGGWLYVPTASGGDSASGSSGFLYAYQRGVGVDGKPTLNRVAESKEAFGFSSSRPIVTSDGLTSGTAIVWIVWSPSGGGAGSQLRAYRALPNGNGDFDLLYRAPVGQSSKFNPPGVGDGRIYVGTRDGHVLGFGSPVTPVLTATPADLGNVVVGSSFTFDVQVTAARALTIQSVLSSSDEFVVGSVVSPELAAGASTTVPVTFRPTSSGLKGASLVITSNVGSASTSLTGKGLAAIGELSLSAPALSFGGTTVNTPLTQQLVLRNSGATPLILKGFTAPAAPFSVPQLPNAGTELAPDESLTLMLYFTPTAVGGYVGELGIESSSGTATVPLSGECAGAAHLTVTPLEVEFGRVAVGGTRFAKFELKNTGGIALTITKSKPPVASAFKATTELAEATVIGVNQVLTEWVSYTPSAAAEHNDVWTLNSNADNGLLEVKFHGTGVSDGVTSTSVSGWQLNGSASAGANEFTLTDASTSSQHGSVFWKTALSTSKLDVSFDTIVGGGNGADGLAFVLADSTKEQATALGSSGGGLGFLGIHGLALGFDTYQAGLDPSDNFLGFSDGPLADSTEYLNWLVTSTMIPALRGDVPVTRHVRFYQATPGAASSNLVVELDGAEVFRRAIALPKSAYFGFSGANGGNTDRHAIANVSIVVE
jgi:outer membrane protein assembly factor BamB